MLVSRTAGRRCCKCLAGQRRDATMKALRYRSVAPMSTSNSPDPDHHDSNPVAVPKATRSELLAGIVTGPGASAMTLASYSGAGSQLEVADLSTELHKIGNEVESGNLSSIERLLTAQLLVLNAMFNNLAQRGARQDSMKNFEALTRLALKAQSQARATAESLALIKNPTPYIRQANIANGPQQINNGVNIARAGKKFFAPNELMEKKQDGEWLDAGATSPPGRTHQDLASLEPIHRTGDRAG